MGTVGDDYDDDFAIIGDPDSPPPDWLSGRTVQMALTAEEAWGLTGVATITSIGWYLQTGDLAAFGPPVFLVILFSFLTADAEDGRRK